MPYLIPRELNKRKATITCRHHPSILSTDKMSHDQIVCSLNLVTDTAQGKRNRGLAVTPAITFSFDLHLDRYNEEKKGFEAYTVSVNGLCNHSDVKCEGVSVQGSPAAASMSPDIMAQLVQALSQVSKSPAQLQTKQSYGGLVGLSPKTPTKVSKAESMITAPPSEMKQSTKKEIPTSSFFKPSQAASITETGGTSQEVLKQAMGKHDYVLESAEEAVSELECNKAFKIFGHMKNNNVSIIPNKEIGYIWIPSKIIEVKGQKEISTNECEKITEYQTDLGYDLKTFYLLDASRKKQCNVYSPSVPTSVEVDEEQFENSFNASAMPKINQEWGYNIKNNIPKGVCLPLNYKQGLYKPEEFKKTPITENICNMIEANLPKTFPVWDAKLKDEKPSKQQIITNVEINWQVRWNKETGKCESYDPKTNTILEAQPESKKQEEPIAPTIAPIQKMPTAPPSPLKAPITPVQVTGQKQKSSLSPPPPPPIAIR